MRAADITWRWRGYRSGRAARVGASSRPCPPRSAAAPCSDGCATCGSGWTGTSATARPRWRPGSSARSRFPPASSRRCGPTRPCGPSFEPAATAIHAFAGGRFDPGRRALARCRELGYQVSDLHAVTRVWEGGRLCEARYLVGDGHSEYDAVTGELTWADATSRQLPLREVGPVAFSEGMRMAAAVFGGRTADGLDG